MNGLEVHFCRLFSIKDKLLTNFKLKLAVFKRLFLKAGLYFPLSEIQNEDILTRVK